jgi:hypothetical protein
MKLIRDAAADPEIVAHIEKVVGPGKLSLQGSCLVLGLAAVTALDANIGKATALTLADVKKRREARERATRPALAPLDRRVPPEAAERPELSPIPVDAWGKDVR